MEAMIVIDVSSMAHRYWHAVKSHNAVIYGVLKSIRVLQDTLDIDLVSFCFDSETHLRRQLDPQYKANRTKEGKEDLHRQINELRNVILPALGFNNLFHQEGYEADDMIAAVVQSWSGENESVIVSTDTDMYQLLKGDKVTIWNPSSRHQCTISEGLLYQKTKLTPAQHILMKAIMGDIGDNIPGVKGAGPVYSAHYVLGNLPKEHRMYTLIEAANKRTAINYQLIRLPWEGTPVPIIRRNALTSKRWDKIAAPYGLHLTDTPRH